MRILCSPVVGFGILRWRGSNEFTTTGRLSAKIIGRLVLLACILDWGDNCMQINKITLFSQDGQLPEESVYKLAYDIVKALQ